MACGPPSRALHGLAARACLVESREIVAPELVLARAEVVQILPRIDAGVVPVRELGTNRIVADGLDLGNRHGALARLQRLLSRAVSAHFGGGRVHAQEFVRQLERASILERELEVAGLVV